MLASCRVAFRSSRRRGQIVAAQCADALGLRPGDLGEPRKRGMDAVESAARYAAGIACALA